MDIIRDILTRVQQRVMDRIMDQMNLPEELVDILTQVDREVRVEWGGERVFVAKTCEADLMHAAARNGTIRRSWKAGEPVGLIAERHGLSRRHVYRIVRGEV